MNFQIMRHALLKEMDWGVHGVYFVVEIFLYTQLLWVEFSPSKIYIEVLCIKVLNPTPSTCDLILEWGYCWSSYDEVILE